MKYRILVTDEHDHPAYSNEISDRVMAIQEAIQDLETIEKFKEIAIESIDIKMSVSTLEAPQLSNDVEQEYSRKRSLYLYDHKYSYMGRKDDPCIYCGSENSTEWDHVPPLHWVEHVLSLGRPFSLRKYRACRQCNSILRDSLFTNINQRRLYVQLWKHVKALRSTQEKPE